MHKDCNMSIQRCKHRAPLIAEVVEKSRWPRSWDGALEHGGRYTAGLQAHTKLVEGGGSVKTLTLI